MLFVHGTPHNDSPRWPSLLGARPLSRLCAVQAGIWEEQCLSLPLLLRHYPHGHPLSAFKGSCHPKPFIQVPSERRSEKGRTNVFSSGFHIHNSIRKHARGSSLIRFTRPRFSTTLVPVSGFQYFSLFFFPPKILQELSTPNAFLISSLPRFSGSISWSWELKPKWAESHF